jgi:23S rRNA pseudouridine2605 synthase
MRLNKYIALATGMSRRSADKAIADRRVRVNGHQADVGIDVSADDKIILDSQPLQISEKLETYTFNKPAGYVVSRDGQGSRTIYELIPPELHHLKPVGRLDKDSSGLLLLTNDGLLANKLTHPKYQKLKVYEVELLKPLTSADKAAIERGVMLEDGISHMKVGAVSKEQRTKTRPGSLLTTHSSAYEVRMKEGRNRQIRRTFAALGYTVKKLHRIRFGPYALQQLNIGELTRAEQEIDI